MLTLYICTVNCEITFLRRNGVRLHPRDWPAPVAGDLRMEYSDGRKNNMRRTLREFHLYERWISLEHSRHRLADPIPVDILGDAMLWRGYTTAMTPEGLAEFEQLWLIRPRPTLDDTPLPAFDWAAHVEQLPQAIAPTPERAETVAEQWHREHVRVSR